MTILGKCLPVKKKTIRNITYLLHLQNVPRIQIPLFWQQLGFTWFNWDPVDTFTVPVSKIKMKT